MQILDKVNFHGYQLLQQVWLWVAVGLSGFRRNGDKLLLLTVGSTIWLNLVYV